jgi:hypothetical protein
MKLRFTEHRNNIRVMLGAFLFIGITLIIQPDKYDKTPSYGLLLQIFDQLTWGIIYLVAFALLSLSRFDFGRWSITVSTIAHTFAIALTASWLLAFIIRYISDDATTIVNVVSWGVFTILLITSAFDVSDVVITEVPRYKRLEDA